MWLTAEALAKTPPTPPALRAEPTPRSAEAAVGAPTAPIAIAAHSPSPAPVHAVIQVAAPSAIPMSSAASETTFYSHASGVRITNTRAVFGTKVYAMANVSSVGMTVTPPKRLYYLLLLAVGVLLFAAQPLIGVIVTILAVVLLALQKSLYHVTIGSASGETSALSSTDGEHIAEIVRAMNEAFVTRG
jgi:hypothetical protein